MLLNRVVSAGLFLVSEPHRTGLDEPWNCGQQHFTGLFTGAYLVHVLSLAIVVLAVRSNVNVDWLAIVVLTVRSNVNVDWLDRVFFWMYSPHSGDD